MHTRVFPSFCTIALGAFLLSCGGTAITDNGEYQIISKETGQCIEAAEHPSSGTTEPRMHSYTAGENQIWKFRKDAQGFYAIINKKSGKVLTAGKGNPSLADDRGTPDQKWTLEKNAEGFYPLRLAKTGLVIDLTRGYAFNGAKLCIYGSTGSSNQQWAILPASRKTLR
jgi:hypothetical protein